MRLERKRKRLERKRKKLERKKWLESRSRNRTAEVDRLNSVIHGRDLMMLHVFMHFALNALLWLRNSSFLPTCNCLEADLGPVGYISLKRTFLFITPLFGCKFSDSTGPTG
jgi:hypothetical protein